MPFHPAKSYMDKLDAATAAPMARLREQTGAGSSTTLRDRLDMARGKTGVEKRWAATGGKPQQGEEEDESNVTPVRAQGRAPPPPPASRIGSAGPPPPPPSRGSAPPPPARGAAPPPPARGAAPPPPARGAAPSLPPRMANEGGTPHPPPAYGAAVAPPPPPPRTNSAASGAGAAQQEYFKWSSITQEEKEAFFEMLDEFFTSRVSLSHTPPPRRTGDATHVVAPRIPATAVAGAADKGASSPAVGAVPSLSASSHAGDAVPLAWAASLFFQERTDARAWGGAAPWFTQHATPPPPLAQRKDLIWRGQYSYSGAQRTLVGAAAFEDLSALWYRVSWTQPSAPRVELAWRRAPAALAAEALQAGSAAYGELVAAFAERAEAARQHVGDGECWTLAHEALLHANVEGGFAEHERCFEGIGRTHGHLIYAATPAGGRWRGGDLARASCGGVRRGVILEWREARCSVVDAPRGSYMDIGAPEHTAVVVKDAPVPREMEYEEEGCEMHPNEMEPIEVVEQSARELPTRRTYDLATFTRGQLWIYRPVAEHGYTGGAVAAAWPPVGERIEPIA